MTAVRARPYPEEYGKTRVRELGASRALAEAVSHLRVALSIFAAAGATGAAKHARKAVTAADDLIQALGRPTT